MNTETTPIRFTTLYGPLYIAVMRANLSEWNDTERGNVSELRPRLRIASDPAFEADPAAEDHWTIRGRAYAVHYEILHNRRSGEWERGDHTPYQGGFRKANRGPVAFRTATWDAMWEEVIRALDTFDATHPGWKNLSSYLHYRGQCDSHEFKAAQLRREAADEESKALTFAAEAASCAGGVPEPMLALIKKER